MSAPTVAIISPARTSSGGGTVSKHLLASLESGLGHPVPHAGVPGIGRYELPKDILDADVLLCLGTRVVGRPGQHRMFWPLNVAPVDASINRLPYIGAKNRARQAALRAALAVAVARADSFIFGSHYARSVYLARYASGAAKPYVVVPNGPPSLDPLRRAEFVPNGHEPFRILCCSHLDAYKGIIELVDAIALLPPDVRRRVQLRLAGADREPRYAAAVRHRIEAHELADHVTVGPAHGGELAKLYESADLFVFPSMCENAGSLSLFDAFHAGLPTICSDRSSMPEIARGAARMVNPHDPHQMSAAITAVITSEALRRDLAARAVAWSDAAPSWEDRGRVVLGFVKARMDQ